VAYDTSGKEPLPPMDAAPMHLLFLSQNLERGGAERQLAMLAGGLARRGHRITVASFYGGALATELNAAGCTVVDLDKRGRWDIIAVLSRTARLLASLRPDLIHSYLPVPNVLATALRPAASGAALVWGIRAAGVDLSAYDRLSRLSYRLESRLAGFADRIIVNSRRGEADAIARGFPAERLSVVPNGIDTGRNRPDAVARAELRAELGVPDDAPLIGLVARLDPMKDHATFFAAAAMLAERLPSVRFVLAGHGIEPGNPVLSAAGAGALTGRIHLLGPRDDIPRIMAALDLYCLSSAFGEGFPNVLGEAMACGVPCVATDVGDAAWILGETGPLVPPRDPAALAAALAAQLERVKREGEALRTAARERILSRFDVATLLERSERLLFDTVQNRRRRGAGSGQGE